MRHKFIFRYRISMWDLCFCVIRTAFKPFLRMRNPGPETADGLLLSDATSQKSSPRSRSSGSRPRLFPEENLESRDGPREVEINHLRDIGKTIAPAVPGRACTFTLYLPGGRGGLKGKIFHLLTITLI